MKTLKGRMQILPTFVVPFLLLLGIITSCNKNKSNDNEIIADSVINETRNLIYTNPQEAKRLFTNAQNSITDSDTYYIMELYKGISYMVLNDEASFNKVFNRVNDYCTAHPSAHRLKGSLWNHKAILLLNKGQRDSALLYFNDAYDETMKTGNKNSLIDICINLADVYLQQGKTAMAINEYRRALFLSDSLKDDKSYFSLLSGIGQTYADLGNYKYSDMYFKKAFSNIKKANIYESFFFYNCYGFNRYIQKKYPEAIDAFRKAKYYAAQISHPDLIATTESNLGETFMATGNLDSATIYLKNAEKKIKAINPIDSGKIFYINSLLMELSYRKHDYVQAKKYLDLTPDTFTTIPQYLAYHYNRLRNYYETQSDYYNAYKYLQLKDRYDDSVRNQMLRNQIMEISYRYQQDTLLLNNNVKVAKKEKQVNSLTIFAYANIAIIVTLIALGIFYIRYKKKKKELSELSMRADLYSLRMENIRNRISPHFIFNVLNRELDPNNKGINNLIHLLRLNLELCQRYVVTLTDEIDFINKYIELEQPALGDNFTYKCNVEDNIDTNKVMIPSMMLQIFVENAIKHGLRGYKDDKYLYLNISKDSHDNIIITLKNNGHPFNQKTSASSTGLGLKIVTQTIQILNDHNKNKILLECGHKEDLNKSYYWEVKIVLPLNYDFSLMEKNN